jgi:hypothetical protein
MIDLIITPYYHGAGVDEGRDSAGDCRLLAIKSVLLASGKKMGLNE